MSDQTPHANTSAADRLIADLEDDGRIESVGQFTLDRERSREQLASYQLEDPDVYVLELLQAVLLRGATRVDVEVDANDFILRAQGAVFDGDDLDLLYEDLLNDAEDPRAQSRRLLGRAVASALALDPRWIDLRSGGAGATRRLLVRPGQPDRLERSAEGTGGTVLHVKRSLGVDIGTRAMENVSGQLPEERLIRQGGAHADIDIVLEGETVSHGMALPGAARSAPLRLDDGDGLVGFVGPTFGGSPAPSEVRYLQHGVVVVQERLYQPVPVGLVAVVSSPRLRRDLSRKHIVQDARWESIRDEVLRQGRALLRDLLDWHRTKSLMEHDRPEWSRAVLRYAAVSAEHSWPALHRTSLFPLLTATPPQKYLSLDRLARALEKNPRFTYVTLARAQMAAGPMRELTRLRCLQVRDKALLSPLQEQLGVALVNRDDYARSFGPDENVVETSPAMALVIALVVLIILPTVFILLAVL